MDVPSFFIRPEQIPLRSHAVHIIIRDRIPPFVFEAASVFENQLVHQVFAAFHHDNELISVSVHEPYVRLAEISPVEDEPGISVTICLRLFQHVLQL